MKPLVLILAVFALAAIVVLTLQARQESTTGVESQTNVVRASEQSQDGSAVEVAPTMAPSTASARTTEEPLEEQLAVTPPTLDVVPPAAPSAPVDGSDFSWKYKGFTMSQLNDAHAEVSSAVGMEHWHAMKRAAGNGRGEAVARDKITFTGVAPPNTVDGAFYSETKQSFLKIRMSREEAPGVFELRDELFWITLRLEQIQEEHHESQVEAARLEYERAR